MYNTTKTSTTTRKPIASLLHCSPVSIPKEFNDFAISLAAIYVKHNSLSGLYKMNYDIVYNRVCNLINKKLTENPDFSINNLKQYINENTLFYSKEDIHTLVNIYKEQPQQAFPYVICFFSRKLNSFKRKNISYTKRLEDDEIDEVMMISLYKTLEKYTPGTIYAFHYLDLELFAAITQLAGELNTFSLSRNDYVNYLKLSYYIEKYDLTLNNLKQFIYEINLSADERLNTSLTFTIEERDLEYSCHITLKKAYDFYDLYSRVNAGIVETVIYNEENGLLLDNTIGVTDHEFENVEMDVFVEQTFPDETDAEIFYHLSEPNGATFTNQELKEKYKTTRYALSKMKEQIKNEYF